MSDQTLIEAFLAKQPVTFLAPAIAKGSNYKAEALAKYDARTARYAAIEAAEKAREAKAKATAEACRKAYNLAKRAAEAEEYECYLAFCAEQKAIKEGLISASDAVIVIDMDYYLEMQRLGR